MARLIGFLLLPLYSRILLPSDYGVLGLYNSSFYLLFVFLVFGMDSAVFRFYYDKEDAEHQRVTTATWIWFQLFLSGILLLLVFFFKAEAGRLLFNIRDGNRIIVYLTFALALYALPNIQEVWFRIKRKPWGAFLFAAGTTLLNIVCTFYFIVYRKAGYWGFVEAQIISYGAGTSVSLFLLRHHLNPRYFNAALLRQMLKYAMPLVPAASLNIGITWACNYMLSRFAGYGEGGLYNMGSSFASILTLVTTSFGQAYVPYAYSIMKRDDAPQFYARVFLFYVSLLSLLTLGYGLFSGEVLQLLTRSQYHAADLVMIILAYNFFFLSLTTLANIGSGIQKNSKPYSVGVISATIVSIGLFAVMIPYMGKEGAALALLLGQLIIPVVAFRASQKMYPIPYDFKSCILIVLTSIAGSFFFYRWFKMDNLVLGIAVKSLFLVCYGLFLVKLLIRKNVIASLRTGIFSKRNDA